MLTEASTYNLLLYRLCDCPPYKLHPQYSKLECPRRGARWNVSLLRWELRSVLLHEEWLYQLLTEIFYHISIILFSHCVLLHALPERAHEWVIHWFCENRDYYLLISNCFNLDYFLYRDRFFRLNLIYSSYLLLHFLKSKLLTLALCQHTLQSDLSLRWQLGWVWMNHIYSPKDPK